MHTVDQQRTSRYSTTSVRALGLSRRATNVLWANDIRTGAQLLELTFEQVLCFRNAGVKTAGEIMRWVEENRVVAAGTTQQGRESAAPAGTPGIGIHSRVLPPDVALPAIAIWCESNVSRESVNEPISFHIPPDLAKLPVSVLEPVPALAKLFEQIGVVCLEDLQLLAERAALHDAGPELMRRFALALPRHLRCPDFLRAIHLRSNAPLWARKHRAAVLQGVLQSNSPSQELTAVVHFFPERTRDVICTRWHRTRGRLVTLDDIGKQYGITRERVRQIIAVAQANLLALQLPLRHSASVFATLSENGGCANTDDLVAMVRKFDRAFSQESLAILSALSEMRVIEEGLRYLPGYDLWGVGDQINRLAENNQLKREVQSAKARVAEQIRILGAIRKQTFDRLVSVHVPAPILMATNGGLKQVGDYLIPASSRESRVSRLVSELLLIAGALPLDEVVAGLRQMTKLNRIAPGLVDAVCKSHRKFTFCDGTVHLSAYGHQHTKLGRSSAALVSVIESCGGIVHWWQMVDGMVERGFSAPLVPFIARRPFVRKVGTAMYALRGREIDQALLRQRRSERARERKRSSSYRIVAPGVYEAQFRLTRFSVAGVLSVPGVVRRLTDATRLTGVLPNGTRLALRLRNGLMWSLMPWLQEERAQIGDTVVAKFVLDEAKVELSLVRASMTPVSVVASGVAALWTLKRVLVLAGPRSHQDMMLLRDVDALAGRLGDTTNDDWKSGTALSCLSSLDLATLQQALEYQGKFSADLEVEAPLRSLLAWLARYLDAG